MSHAAPPALDTDHGVALAEHTKLDGIHNAPLQTAVNVLLPWLRLEVWLLLGEVEWVNAAIKVRVLLLLVVASQNDTINSLGKRLRYG